jgi:septal ring-binding cell division protein DamX
MAESRGTPPTDRVGVTPLPGDRKHLARVGSLLVVVLGSLMLGAILQQDEEIGAVIEPEVAIVETAPVAQTPTAAPDTTLPSGNEHDQLDEPVDVARPAVVAQPEPTEPTQPAASSSLSDLARRAGVDFRRLPSGEAWMLQLAAICDASSVEGLLRQVDDRELHVLPVEIQDRACFRICWGPYDSRAGALAAADELPGPIRSLTDAPQPRLVSSLTP